MIGNDVVDLRDRETAAGALHPRFDSRVFDAWEQNALEVSGVPRRLRWIFWAAKEAAYKVARKRDPRTQFVPQRFAVRLGPELRGEVRFGDLRLAVSVDSDAERVHAVANDGPSRDSVGHARVLRVQQDADASLGARALARSGIAKLLDLDPGAIAFGREDRVPRVFLAGAAAPVDLSLSHHGRFVAFACMFDREASRDVPG